MASEGRSVPGFLVTLPAGGARGVPGVFSFYFRTQVGLRYVLMCVPLGYLLAAPKLGHWAQSPAQGAILVGGVVALALLETGDYVGNQLSLTFRYLCLTSA